MAQRREAREAALQALYANEISKDTSTHITTTVLKPKLRNDKDALEFAEQLFINVVDNQQTVDELISNHIKNWRIERLTTVDRLVLRMAIAEFLFFQQIPTKVTMNEAIEIVKRFSTKSSGNFVNGILDSVLKQLQNEDRIDKSGRGLIESSFNS